MARKWSKREERTHREQLKRLYVRENKTITEVGKILNLADSSIFDRLRRLGIPTVRTRKIRFNNRRNDIVIPSNRSDELAEFFGIMLGDGCLTHYQVSVTLGSKEIAYAKYVQGLLQRIFGGQPRIAVLSRGHTVVYLGSTLATGWLMREGLVRNKVKSQVDVPQWIYKSESYMESFLRGFFDTDGSIYKLRFGVQISFTNHSLPILHSLHRMLKALGYKASTVSAYRVYLTRIPDVKRFFTSVKPGNPKHQRRFRDIMRRSYSGNYTRL